MFNSEEESPERKEQFKAVRMYDITKQSVKRAYELVRANKGSAGVDNVTITEFETNLENNLYKIWNRMSSGSYMPPAVRMVEIPKSDGKVRKLGIPTVADRVAQMVAKLYLEPLIEPYFHPDSYGYRPGKSAHDAIGKVRTRCWRSDWVIDLDIKGFFDNLDHELVMRAVERHTEIKWLHLYVRRWLKAPVEHVGGKIEERTQGTPQGGVISPLLANLFLHYAFDGWMKKHYPGNQFARYADDIIVHCQTLEEAEKLKLAIELRLKECKLELHPEKTRIVYCKDDDRKGGHPQEQFDFLGYTFRPRQARSKHGKYFISFLPAISTKAEKRIRQTIRDWKRQWNSGKSLEDIAEDMNPRVRGWITYYGKYYRSALVPLMNYLNKRLVRWAAKKYKRLKRSIQKGVCWMQRIIKKQPELFAHWEKGFQGISKQ